jgi:hypothetical protein
VWRRPWPCDYHAHEYDESGEPDESDASYDSCQPDDPDNSREPDDSDNPDQSHESEQWILSIDAVRKGIVPAQRGVGGHVVSRLPDVPG